VSQHKQPPKNLLREGILSIFGAGEKNRNFKKNQLKKFQKKTS
jgi:hypothetical protein